VPRVNVKLQTPDQVLDIGDLVAGREHKVKSYHQRTRLVNSIHKERCGVLSTGSSKLTISRDMGRGVEFMCEIMIAATLNLRPHKSKGHL
jgi:hypothetical protein